MEIRDIEEKDNKQVEELIRTCLLEFGANKPGCAWEDPDLGKFYQVYQPDNCKYWVVEHEGKVVAGCGIGPVIGKPEVCELQKMYCLDIARGAGIAKQLLELALSFAKEHYQYCYLETFANMIAANKFYIKNGFISLDKPIIEGAHYACDRWYIKKL